jgi:hypothetical protein
MEDIVSDVDTLCCTLSSSFWEEEDCIQTIFVALSNDKNHFRSALSRQVTKNCSGKIRRLFLMSPSNSAFMHLFRTGQDDVLITMTGFDYATFHELLEHFSPLFISTHLILLLNPT